MRYIICVIVNFPLIMSYRFKGKRNKFILENISADQ